MINQKWTGTESWKSSARAALATPCKCSQSQTGTPTSWKWVPNPLLSLTHTLFPSDHRCLKNGQKTARGRHQWGKCSPHAWEWTVQVTRWVWFRCTCSKRWDTPTLSPTKSLLWTSAVSVSWWTTPMAVICTPKSPTKRKLEEVSSIYGTRISWANSACGWSVCTIYRQLELNLQTYRHGT